MQSSRRGELPVDLVSKLSYFAPAQVIFRTCTRTKRTYEMSDLLSLQGLRRRGAPPLIDRILKAVLGLGLGLSVWAALVELILWSLAR